MTRTTLDRLDGLTRKHKLSAAGVAVAGASVLAFTVAPGSAHAANLSNPVMSAAMAWSTSSDGATTKTEQVNVSQQAAEAVKRVQGHASAQHQAARHKADEARRNAPQAASRSESRPAAPAHAAPAQPAPVSYPDNLDGWIRQSLDIMHRHGIPGSYEGIRRNIIRESSGDPNAINNWDINARNGIPSKGLLQVIDPTFNAFHVAGTSHNIYDPVANIVAACNYAANRYGSMDNVNSAY
ncbi:transglycosylase SLT domain-containing protein [Streptantibioticus ferralitis]|uniref:Transglycosylase SLT domain-containing protein n=1 Tax=Streptantibioticus ferralitis TaxID=236510 RepID=A0ABT5YUW5_9ACTN|nr:transglycosylase SLT domain-containing protein [Streptantibioticus ferralitis]MDF2255268.1 transglycosylase SLT domain-containing protein [Streptantibioticus ferralitis]